MIATLPSSRSRSRTTQLGWIDAESPTARCGGDSKTDVYIKDIGDEGIYGYATTDPGQVGPQPLRVPGDGQRLRRRRSSRATRDPRRRCRSRAAHEYNHVLQYGYDAFAGHLDVRVDRDVGRGEGLRRRSTTTSSTSTRGHWRPTSRSPHPATASPPIRRPQDVRLGDLEPLARRRYGPRLVREAWASSRTPHGRRRRLRARAYDRRSRTTGGPGFATELRRVRGRDRRVGRGRQRHPRGRDVPRRGHAQRHAHARRHGGDRARVTTPRSRSTTCPSRAAPTSLDLTGGAARAARAARSRSSASTATDQDARGALLDADGRVTVTLADPVRFARITAVVVNTDTSNRRLRADDVATGSGRGTPTFRLP